MGHVLTVRILRSMWKQKNVMMQARLRNSGNIELMIPVSKSSVN